MTRVLRRLEDGWELLMGADPGRLRLIFALRLFLMATITVLGLIGVNYWGKMPLGAIGLGFMIAQFNAGAVRDPTRRGQAVTSVLVAVSGLGGAALASFVSPWPVGSELVLIALVFIATLARPAGPRAMGCGMLAFIGFYINLIIRVPPARLPFDLAATVYAVLVALLVRLVLLPERPERNLPRVVRSVKRQAARLLDTIAGFILAGGEGRHWAGRIVRRTMRLEEAVQAAEDQILQAGGKPAESGWNRLGMALFELHLGAQRIARLSTSHGAPPPQPRLLSEFAALTRALGLTTPDYPPGRLQRGRERIARDRLAEADLEDALTWLWAVIARLPDSPDAILAAAREPVSPDSSGETGKPEDQKADQPKQSLWSRLSPLLRQPVQVAVATGVAMGAGHMISGRRWYWSVLAAFIVFAGTSSRATTLVKGAQRVLGTVLGVGAGLLIARAVMGHPKPIVALALICDAIAFYAFQTAYAVMIFWITIMLALLYALLGMFHPALLEIRLDETAVGAAAGIVVALTLLPRRTSQEMRKAGLQFLDDLRAALAALPHVPAQAGDVGRARDVARSIQALRTAAGPLGRGWVTATSPEIRRTVRAAMASSYWLHELAAALRDRPEAEPLAAKRIEQVAAALEKVRGAIEAGEPPPPVARPRDLAEDAGCDPTMTALCALAEASERFVRALDQVTQRRKLSVLGFLRRRFGAG